MLTVFCDDIITGILLGRLDMNFHDMVKFIKFGTDNDKGVSYFDEDLHGERSDFFPVESVKYCLRNYIKDGDTDFFKLYPDGLENYEIFDFSVVMDIVRLCNRLNKDGSMKMDNLALRRLLYQVGFRLYCKFDIDKEKLSYIKSVGEVGIYDSDKRLISVFKLNKLVDIATRDDINISFSCNLDFFKLNN